MPVINPPKFSDIYRKAVTIQNSTRDRSQTSIPNASDGDTLKTDKEGGTEYTPGKKTLYLKSLLVSSISTYTILVRGANTFTCEGSTIIDGTLHLSSFEFNYNPYEPISIGYQAGAINPGLNSIAIGPYAGYSNQPESTIIFSATGSSNSPSDGNEPNRWHVDPIRYDPTPITGFGSLPMYYNPLTSEVYQGSLYTGARYRLQLDNIVISSFVEGPYTSTNIIEISSIYGLPYIPFSNVQTYSLGSTLSTTKLTAYTLVSTQKLFLTNLNGTSYTQYYIISTFQKSYTSTAIIPIVSTNSIIISSINGVQYIPFSIVSTLSTVNVASTIQSAYVSSLELTTSSINRSNYTPFYIVSTFPITATVSSSVNTETLSTNRLLFSSINDVVFQPFYRVSSFSTVNVSSAQIRTLSTLELNVSSMNGVPFQPFYTASTLSDGTVSSIVSARYVSTQELLFAFMNGIRYQPFYVASSFSTSVTSNTQADTISTQQLFISSMNGTEFIPYYVASSFSTVATSTFNAESVSTKQLFISSMNGIEFVPYFIVSSFSTVNTSTMTAGAISTQRFLVSSINESVFQPYYVASTFRTLTASTIRTSRVQASSIFVSSISRTPYVPFSPFSTLTLSTFTARSTIAATLSTNTMLVNSINGEVYIYNRVVSTFSTLFVSTIGVRTISTRTMTVSLINDDIFTIPVLTYLNASSITVSTFFTSTNVINTDEFTTQFINGAEYIYFTIPSSFSTVVIQDYSFGDIYTTNTLLTNNLSTGFLTANSVLVSSLYVPVISSVRTVALQGTVSSMSVDKLSTNRFTGTFLNFNSISSSSISSGSIRGGLLTSTRLSTNNLSTGTLFGNNVRLRSLSTSALIASTIYVNNLYANTVVIVNNTTSTSVERSRTIVSASVNYVSSLQVVADSGNFQQMNVSTLSTGSYSGQFGNYTRVNTNTVSTGILLGGTMLISNLSTNSISAAQIIARTGAFPTISANTISTGSIQGSILVGSGLAAGSMGVPSSIIKLGTVSSITASYLSTLAVLGGATGVTTVSCITDFTGSINATTGSITTLGIDQASTGILVVTTATVTSLSTTVFSTGTVSAAIGNFQNLTTNQVSTNTGFLGLGTAQSLSTSQVSTGSVQGGIAAISTLNTAQLSTASLVSMLGTVQTLSTTQVSTGSIVGSLATLAHVSVTTISSSGILSGDSASFVGISTNQLSTGILEGRVATVRSLSTATVAANVVQAMLVSTNTISLVTINGGVYGVQNQETQTTSTMVASTILSYGTASTQSIVTSLINNAVYNPLTVVSSFSTLVTSSIGAAITSTNQLKLVNLNGSFYSPQVYQTAASTVKVTSSFNSYTISSLNIDLYTINSRVFEFGTAFSNIDIAYVRSTTIASTFLTGPVSTNNLYAINTTLSSLQFSTISSVFIRSGLTSTLQFTTLNANGSPYVIPYQISTFSTAIISTYVSYLGNFSSFSTTVVSSGVLGVTTGSVSSIATRQLSTGIMTGGFLSAGTNISTSFISSGMNIGSNLNIGTQITTGFVSANSIAIGSLVVSSLTVTVESTPTIVFVSTITIPSGNVDNTSTGTTVGIYASMSNLTLSTLSTGTFTGGNATFGSLSTTSISSGKILGGPTRLTSISTSFLSSGSITGTTVGLLSLSTNQLSTGRVAETNARITDLSTVTISTGSIVGHTTTLTQLSTNTLSTGSIVGTGVGLNTMSTGSLVAGSIAGSIYSMALFSTLNITGQLSTGSITSGPVPAQVGSLSTNYISTGSFQGIRVPATFSQLSTTQLSSGDIVGTAGQNVGFKSFSTNQLSTTTLLTTSAFFTTISTNAVSTGSIIRPTVSLTLASMSTGFIAVSSVQGGNVTYSNIVPGELYTGTFIGSGTIPLVVNALSTIQVSTSRLLTGSAIFRSISTNILSTVSFITSGSTIVGSLSTGATSTIFVQANGMVANLVTISTISTGTILGTSNTSLFVGTFSTIQISTGSLIAGNASFSSITSEQFSSGTITSGNVQILNSLSTNTLATQILQAGGITTTFSQISTNQLSTGILSGDTSSLSTLSSINVNLVSSGSIIGNIGFFSNIRATQLSTGILLTNAVTSIFVSISTSSLSTGIIQGGSAPTVFSQISTTQLIAGNISGTANQNPSFVNFSTNTISVGTILVGTSASFSTLNVRTLSTDLGIASIGQASFSGLSTSAISASGIQVLEAAIVGQVTANQFIVGSSCNTGQQVLTTSIVNTVVMAGARIQVDTGSVPSVNVQIYDITTFPTPLMIATGCATTPSNTIQWSIDGSNWFGATTGGFKGFTSNTYSGYGVAYDYMANMFVAVGSGSNTKDSIQWSTDGSNWSPAITGGFSGLTAGVSNYGNSVSYVGGLWVAAGGWSNTVALSGSSNQAIQISTDGMNWGPASRISYTGTMTEFHNVAYGPCNFGTTNTNVWAATARAFNGATANGIFYSTDAYTWQQNTFSFGYSNGAYAILYNATISQWMIGQNLGAVGTGGNTLFGTNIGGASWNQTNGGSTAVSGSMNIFQGPTAFIFSCVDGSALSYASECFTPYSNSSGLYRIGGGAVNGFQQVDGGIYAGFNATYYATPTYSNYYAVGWGQTSSLTILKSTDGSNWPSAAALTRGGFNGSNTFWYRNAQYNTLYSSTTPSNVAGFGIAARSFLLNPFSYIPTVAATTAFVSTTSLSTGVLQGGQGTFLQLSTNQLSTGTIRGSTTTMSISINANFLSTSANILLNTAIQFNSISTNSLSTATLDGLAVSSTFFALSTSRLSCGTIQVPGPLTTIAVVSTLIVSSQSILGGALNIRNISTDYFFGTSIISGPPIISTISSLFMNQLSTARINSTAIYLENFLFGPTISTTFVTVTTNGLSTGSIFGNPNVRYNQMSNITISSGILTGGQLFLSNVNIPSTIFVGQIGERSTFGNFSTVFTNRFTSRDVSSIQSSIMMYNTVFTSTLINNSFNTTVGNTTIRSPIGTFNTLGITNWNSTIITTGNVNVTYPSLLVATGAMSNTVTPQYTIQYSTDSLNWSPANSGGFSNALNSCYVGLGVAFGSNTLSGQWVAVGVGSSAANTILTSSNGSDWANAVSGGFNGATQYGMSVAYGNGLWAACGLNTTTVGNAIQISIDGSNWSNVNMPSISLNGVINDIAWGSNKTTGVTGWAAGVTGGATFGATTTAILISTDGSNWSIPPALSPNQLNMPNNIVASVFYETNTDSWYVGGTSGNPSIIYYTSMTNLFNSTTNQWTSVSIANSFGVNKFRDGTASNILYQIGYATNSIYTINYSSNDGMSWSGITTGGFPSVINNTGTGLTVWNGSNYVVTGYGATQQGSILTSTDGCNFQTTTLTGGFTGYTNLVPVTPGGAFSNVATGIASKPITSGSVPYNGLISTIGIISSLNVGGSARISSVNTTSLRVNGVLQITPITSIITSIPYAGADFINNRGVLATTSINRNDMDLFSINNFTYTPAIYVSTLSTSFISTGSSIAPPSTLMTGYTIPLQPVSHLLVAAGFNNIPVSTLLYSINGCNWFPAASGGFNSNQSLLGTYTYAFPYGIHCVNNQWNSPSNVWVAVGNGSSPQNSILNSTDGSNWQNAVSGGFSNYIAGIGPQFLGRGLAYGAGVWMAIGQSVTSMSNSSIQTSTDGCNWTAIPPTNAALASLTTGFADYAPLTFGYSAGSPTFLMYNGIPNPGGFYYTSNNGLTWYGAGNISGAFNGQQVDIVYMFNTGSWFYGGYMNSGTMGSNNSNLGGWAIINGGLQRGSQTVTRLIYSPGGVLPPLTGLGDFSGSFVTWTSLSYPNTGTWNINSPVATYSRGLVGDSILNRMFVAGYTGTANTILYSADGGYNWSATGMTGNRFGSNPFALTSNQAMGINVRNFSYFPETYVPGNISTGTLIGPTATIQLLNTTYASTIDARFLTVSTQNLAAPVNYSNAMVINSTLIVSSITAGNCGSYLPPSTVIGGYTLVSLGATLVSNPLSQIQYSLDGSNWANAVNGPTTGGATFGAGVTTNGSNIIVAAFGNTNGIMTSSDGSNWRQTYAVSQAFGIAYGTLADGIFMNGTFTKGTGMFVVGGSNAVYLSQNGYNWSNGNILQSPGAIAGLAYGSNANGPIWGGVSWNGTGVWGTTDGSNWGNSNPNSPAVGFMGMAYSPTLQLWVLGTRQNSSSRLYTTTDPKAGTFTNLGAIGSASNYYISWVPSPTPYFYAVGIGGSATNNVMRSTDGTNWSAANLNSSFPTGFTNLFFNMNSVVWNGSVYVASISGNPSAGVTCHQYSTDGLNWRNGVSGGWDAAATSPPSLANAITVVTRYTTNSTIPVAGIQFASTLTVRSLLSTNSISTTSISTSVINRVIVPNLQYGLCNLSTSGNTTVTFNPPYQNPPYVTVTSRHQDLSTVVYAISSVTTTNVNIYYYSSRTGQPFTPTPTNYQFSWISMGT